MNYYMKIVWENGDQAIWKIDKNIKTCRCLLPVRIDDWSKGIKKFDDILWNDDRYKKYDILLEEDVMLELM